MNSILKDMPSVPKAPSFPPLGTSFTSRLAAKKQSRENDGITRNLASIIATRQYTVGELDKLDAKRRPPRFLQGVSVPNSIIKSNLKVPEAQSDDQKQIRQERDEYVKKLLNRLQTRKSARSTPVPENVDKVALQKIKKELQKKTTLPKAGNREREKEDVPLVNTKAKITRSKEESWEELKPKRKSPRATPGSGPIKSVKQKKIRKTKLSGEDIPAFNPTKKTIDTTKIMQKILEIENIDKLKPTIGNPKKNTKQGGGRRASVVVATNAQNSKSSKEETKHANKKHRKLALKSENFLITDLNPATLPKQTKPGTTGYPTKKIDMHSQTSIPKITKGGLRTKGSPPI